MRESMLQLKLSRTLECQRCRHLGDGLVCVGGFQVWFVGGLYRVDANCAIEKGGSKEDWVAGTPVNLECPGIRRWELDDVSE